MSIRIAVADDNLIVREGIGRILGGQSDVEVVATCGDLTSLLAAVDREAPEVVVTDIRMPPTNSDEGIQLAARLRETHPDIGVVVLSNYADASYALALMESGSAGRAYLLKERVHHRAQLLAAIESVGAGGSGVGPKINAPLRAQRRAAVESVAAGGSVMDPKIIEPLVAARSRAERSPLGELTPREREVLAEIAQGKSNSAIADDLVLTKRAVEKHINSIFLKLNLAYADDVSKRVKAALLFLSETEL